MPCREHLIGFSISITHTKRVTKESDKRMIFLWNGSLCLEIHKVYKFRRDESDPTFYIYLFRMLTVCLTNLFTC